jgi:hypothetical protein
MEYRLFFDQEDYIEIKLRIIINPLSYAFNVIWLVLIAPLFLSLNSQPAGGDFHFRNLQYAVNTATLYIHLQRFCKNK